MNEQQGPDKQVEQFLTFELDGEAYGVEILKVQEIRGWEPVRKLPDTPEFIKGALNLRGTIVPIVDLRERFQMARVEYTPTTVVIVLSIEVNANHCVMGLIADAVSDVLDIDLDEIKQAPNLGSKINVRYMRGLYADNQRMVILLDIDKLLNPDDFAGIVALQ